MLPRVVIHNAVSVDGRIDGFQADLGLYYELAGRWDEDATLVGSGTVLAADWGPDPGDDAPPSPPTPGDTRPLLVVPDSRGRVRIWNALRRQPYWRNAIAFCSRITPPDYVDYLEGRRVERIVAGDDHVDLRRAGGVECAAWRQIGAGGQRRDAERRAPPRRPGGRGQRHGAAAAHRRLIPQLDPAGAGPRPWRPAGGGRADIVKDAGGRSGVAPLPRAEVISTPAGSP